MEHGVNDVLDDDHEEDAWPIFTIDIPYSTLCVCTFEGCIKVFGIPASKPIPRLNNLKGHTMNETQTYEEIGTEIGKLVTAKQAAYGDSFGKSGEILKILYPKGIGHDELQDALAITRVIDKLFRIATDKDAFGESPWRDIAGYAILSVARSSKAPVP